MQPACDHQVEHDEVVVLEGQDDPLAEAADIADRATDQVRHRWIGCPEQERARDPQALELLSYDPRGEGVEVQRDVRQLGHQLRKRAANCSSRSSPAARARSRIRFTWGRSFGSPQ